MAIAKQVHNQRYGGMSNDEYVATQAGSFWDCSNIDCRQDSKSFQLSKAKIASSVVTGASPMAMGYYASGATPEYAYERPGQIRKLSDMSVIGTVSGIGIVSNTIEFNDSSGASGTFIAGSSGFSKHIIGGAVTNNIGVYSPGTLMPSVTFARPMLKSKLWIYIGDIDGILRYAIDTQVIDRPLVLQKGDVVNSILELGDQIIIFTTNGSNGRQYFWDGVSSLPNRVIEWFANPMYYAAIFKNQIYVLTQNGFYVSDGYNSQLLYRTSPRLDLPNGIWTTNDWAPIRYDTSLDIFYFGIYGKGIFSYGERLPGFGKSLAFEFKCNAFLGFFVSSSGIYFYDSITNPNMSFTHITGYSTSGYLETMPMLGEGFDVLKKSKKLRISYYLPDVAKTGVKVYVSYDDGAYTLLFTSSTTNSVTGYNRRTIQETGQWFKRKLKFELTSTDSTMTPRFYTATSLFENIQDDTQ